MVRYFLIALFLTLLFFPIRIKINIIYNKILNYKISLYKLTIINSTDKKIPKKNTTSKSKRFSFSKEKVISTIKSFKNNPIKPTILLDGKAIFDLEDSAATAILFGSISSLPSFVYRALSMFFKINKFNLCISPAFKNRNSLSLNFESIIKVNLVKIIYILIIFYKNWRWNPLEDI